MTLVDATYALGCAIGSLAGTNPASMGTTGARRRATG